MKYILKKNLPWLKKWEIFDDKTVITIIINPKWLYALWHNTTKQIEIRTDNTEYFKPFKESKIKTLFKKLFNSINW